MRELRRTLLAMRRINEELVKAAKRVDHVRNGTMVSLRQDFSEVSGDFLCRLQELLVERENFALFTKLQEDFDEMRSALIGHQRQWTPEAIAADHDFYLKRKEIIFRKISGFIESSLAAIADDLDAVA